MNLRTRATAAALVVALATLTGSAAVAEDRSVLEQQQQGMSGEIDGARRNLEQSSHAFDQAKKRLNRAKTKLDVAQQHLGATQSQLAGAQAMDAKLRNDLIAAEGTLQQSEEDLKTNKARWKESRKAVASFTVDSLMRGDPRLEAFGDLLNGEDPMKYTERMSLNASISDAQVARMQKLAADRVILELKRKKVAESRDKVAAARTETEKNVVRQKTLTDQARAQRDEVDELVGSRASAKADAAKQRAEDERRVKQLEQERAALEARIAAMVEAEKQAAAQGQGVGDGGGALSAPIAGPITSPYGMRFHPILHVNKLHDGTDFGASCGTPVHAAAGGQIIDQYYNGGYGNRVILNNGVMNGHVITTTYNHLTSFALSKGAIVNRGDIVGYVGSTGYSTGCHLHFMVLVDGVTVDPMGWL